MPVPQITEQYMMKNGESKFDHTRTHTRAMCTKSQNHYGAHTHSAVSQCWKCTGLISPIARLSTLKLCVYACVWVWVGGSVNFSSADTDLSAPYLHMRTMWLTAIPYLFRLATSPHACMHTHSHAGLHTSRHTHTFACIHTFTYKQKCVLSRRNDERQQ